MECLQYYIKAELVPTATKVLNLVINGMPSIHERVR